MQHAKHMVLLAGLTALAGILAACRPIQPAPAETAGPTATLIGELVTLTLTKPGDRSTLGIQDNNLLIDIESASGIGTATVTWTVEPTTPIVLRLHLSGLEELRLANGNVETVASVSSSLPHVVSQATRSEPQIELQSISEGDPAWLEISWSSAAFEGASGDTAAFPLQDGYFDIMLSDPRLTQLDTSLEIHWIDFYR
jgi:hypothetical protein